MCFHSNKCRLIGRNKITVSHLELCARLLIQRLKRKSSQNQKKTQPSENELTYKPLPSCALNIEFSNVRHQTEFSRPTEQDISIASRVAEKNPKCRSKFFERTRKMSKYPHVYVFGMLGATLSVKRIKNVKSTLAQRWVLDFFFISKSHTSNRVFH